MLRGSVCALLAVFIGCAGIAGLDEFVDQGAAGGAAPGGGGGVGGTAACAGEGTPCVTGGLCHNGSCSTTECFIEGSWYTGGDTPGDCNVCDPEQDPLAWSIALRGEPCTDGLCYPGGCCTGCWDGTICHPPSVTLCGIAGSRCTDCTCGGTCPGNCTNDPSCNANATQKYWIPAACNAGICGLGTPECCASTLDCFPAGCGT